MNYFSGKHGVYLIAEIGGNHEGDYQYAVKLLHLAAESGVDAVKFQIYSGDTLVNPKIDPTRNQHFKRFQFKKNEYIKLAQLCAKLNVTFMASVWDLDAIDYIDNYMPIYKIGSGDLTAYNIIESIVKKNKQMILSTGLATINEVIATVKFIEKIDSSFIKKKKLALLQCTTMYPIPDEEANLLVMDTLRRTTSLTVGYSDHTVGMLSVEVAIAMGAEIIEKHFTDTRKGKTFRDHKIAATKDEIIHFIKKIKKIKRLHGSPEKKPTRSEMDAKHLTSFRRAIFPLRDMKAGEVIRKEDLVTLRPCIGIGAQKMNEIIDQILIRDINRLDPFSEDHFQ